MKVRYTSGNGQLVFDVEAETAKALFSQLGSIQELFEAETECGLCQSKDIRYSARVVEEFDFYELACRSCRAQFRFGQKKKGGELFPKRKDDDGNWLPNGGWSRWEPTTTLQAVPVVRTGPRQEQGAPASVPGDVTDMWKRMTTVNGALKEFATLKAELVQQLGRDAGERIYYQKLANFGMEHANEFKKGDEARACARAMLETIVAAKERAVLTL